MKIREMLAFSCVLFLLFTSSGVVLGQEEGSGCSNIGPMAIEGPYQYNVGRYTKGDTSNFARYPSSTEPEPAKGQCVFDEPYDAHVCKVADARDFPVDEIGDAIRPVYSRWRIDNSDGRYYFLVKDGESPKWSGKGQMVIFNAADDSLYKIATEVNGHEGSEFRWDYSGQHPHLLYYRSGCEFRTYDIRTGQTTLVHDFSKEFPLCGRIINDVEGDASADSRYWVWIVQGAYDGAHFPTLAIITYDKESDTILGILDHAKYLQMGGTDTTLPKPNMVDMSPLGSKLVCLWGRTDTHDVFDGPHAYDFDFTDAIKVCNDETHSGWAFDKAGKEVFVCQINNTNWSNAPADTIAYTDIQTGETNAIIFHEDMGWDVGGFHFGRFTNLAIKGWVYMTTYSRSDSQSWMRNQAVMLEISPYTDHPLIWRIADTHNTYPGASGYEREAFSPISGDGLTLWWAADWRSGDGTVDTYKVRLPDQWWEKIRDLAVGAYVDPSGSCNGHETCYSTIQAAVSSAFSRAVIKIRKGLYDESIILDESKTLTLQGGWDAAFENQDGGTILHEAPKATQGSLVLENLIIRPEGDQE